MSTPEEPDPLHRFILEAIDPSLGCPVLEMLLRVTELEKLRKILGDDASCDTDLQMVYVLGPAELRAIDSQYGAKFDPDGRECRLARAHPIQDAPYLVHTGYELFLMLEGMKPFAKFVIEYPAEADEFPGKALFEPHVRSGVLIKRVMADEPFESQSRTSSGRIFEGVRRIFYGLKGEE